MSTIRTRIAKAAAVLTLSAAAVGIAGISPAAAGDPSQWGRARAEVAGDPSQWTQRKVNEYEGQQHKHVNEYEGQKVNEYEHDGNH